ETTSHYLFCFARNFAVGDGDMSKLLYKGSKATFLEDADMLEAVQANRCGGSLDGLVDIGADAAQLQARRLLAQMIAAESAWVARCLIPPRQAALELTNSECN